MADLTGQTLENYRLDLFLGEGEMGGVYKGYDLRRNRVVAIKVIHPKLASQENFRSQFLRDMQLMTALDHSNIVTVYGSGLHDEILYHVLEYVDGGSMGDYIRTHRQSQKYPPIDEVLDYMKQVADGLHYAHDQGFVHHDVKPDNILFKPLEDGDFQMKLSDLGLAQLSQSNLNSDVNPPESALPYISPEIASGQTPEAESDIYSAGVILYELLVGQRPFDPQTVADAVRMHTRAAVPTPTSLRPGLPVELEQIILKCLEKDPSKRYPTGDRLSRALRQLQGEMAHKYQTMIHPDDADGISATFVAFETVPGIQLLHTQPEVAPEDIGKDRLVITAPKQPTRALTVDKNILVVGRDLTADIMLDGAMISRYHARIERLANGEYQVTDLGSTNGSWVGPVRLHPNRSRQWKPGEYLRLGEFRLLLEPATSLDVTHINIIPEQRRSQIDDEAQDRPHYKTIEQVPLEITAKLTPTKIAVQPGETQLVQLNLVNQTGIIDHFRVSVRNVPIDWVTLPSAAVEMLQDASESVSIGFAPPRDSRSTAGLYAYDLVITSRGQPNTYPAIVPGQLEILPFYGYSIDLYPTRLKRTRETKLTLTNGGNTAQTFTITSRDREDGLNIFANPSHVTLDPGQTRQIPITIKPRRRPILGSSERYPFEISVVDEQPESEPKTKDGELAVNPIITREIIVVLFIVITLITGALLCAFNLWVEQQNRNNQQRATEQAKTLERNLTATAESDVDNDGLLYFEEEQLGTDPKNRDTDGDGLDDYTEVKQLGTNPLALDTDKDGLPDGIELNSGCSNPNNPDTDGDGIPDNVDPNPCLQPTPAPPTLPPPTQQIVTPAG